MPTQMQIAVWPLCLSSAAFNPFASQYAIENLVHVCENPLQKCMATFLKFYNTLFFLLKKPKNGFSKPILRLLFFISLLIPQIFSHP